MYAPAGALTSADRADRRRCLARAAARTRGAARMAAAGRRRACCCVALALAGFARNIAANLEARQIKSGFDFLRDPAGFNIGELLFDFTSRDSYLRAFAVGMSNTLAGRARRHRARERARRRWSA